MVNVVGFLIISIHVCTFAQVMAHQTETSIIGRVASHFRLCLYHVLSSILQIGCDIFGHLVQRRAYHILLCFKIAYQRWIKDNRHRTVEVKQIKHRHATQKTRFSHQLLFFLIRKKGTFFQGAYNLCHTGNITYLVKVRRQNITISTGILHVLKLSLCHIDARTTP